MKILNIGIPEILFLVVLIFIVLGPEKMVSSAKDIGTWLRKVSKSPLWHDFVSTREEIKNLPKRLMLEADLDEEVKVLDQLYKEDLQEGKHIFDPKRELEENQEELEGDEKG